MTKTCNSCFILKVLADFPKAATCKDGHRNYCKMCHKERKQVWCVANKERLQVKSAQWVKENPDSKTKANKKWRDSHKEYHFTKSAMWRKTNPEKSRAQVNHRRKNLRVAQPIWADKFLISEIYHLAAIRTTITGFEWHVDHIVPLQGKNVCGLHVENNLQVIPATQNLQKSNKYEVFV